MDPSQSLINKTRNVSSIPKIFVEKNNDFLVFLRAIRINQWVKNILLFIPLITSHKIAEFDLILKLVYAFISFSLCASSVYILNDILDIESDRLHPNKKDRPFAAGLMQIKTGLFFVPIFLAGSLVIATYFLSALFSVAICFYFGITTAYSLYFKRLFLIDVLILAGLYTFRVFAGGLAVNITISTWLLAFSMFFFLSLAFLKRYSELSIMQILNHQYNNGRSYLVEDKNLLQSIGPICGYFSILILLLYINSSQVILLYEEPTVLWLVIPFFLYWITRIWFLAQRGEMQDEPLVFTVKDPISYIVWIIILIILFIATKYSIFQKLIPG